MLLILGVVMVIVYKTRVVELMVLILGVGMVIKVMYYLKDFFKCWLKQQVKGW